MVAIFPFQAAFLALTFWPFCVAMPFQELTIFWVPGNFQVRVQLLIAAPLLVILTSALKPLFHTAVVV